MPNKLTSEIRPAASITPSERATLFALFSRHYADVSEATFARDLSQKDHIILLSRGTTGPLVGFSTQVVEPYQIDGQTIRVLFSGDTIIDPKHWGEQELVRSWCRYAGAALAEAQSASEPLYWLLISKGYRTYLFLPLFFNRYHPGPHEEPELHSLASKIARQRFGGAYHPSSGTLRFPKSCGHLRGTLADISEKRRTTPHVQLFLSKNPGFATGDELVCLAPITETNLRSFAKRSLQEGLQTNPLQSQNPPPRLCGSAPDTSKAIAPLAATHTDP